MGEKVSLDADSIAGITKGLWEKMEKKIDLVEGKIDTGLKSGISEMCEGVKSFIQESTDKKVDQTWIEAHPYTWNICLLATGLIAGAAATYGLTRNKSCEEMPKEEGLS